MNLYTALDKNGMSIATVIAQDVRDANGRIFEQLSKPGRRGYLTRWIEGNHLIERQDKAAMKAQVAQDIKDIWG